MTINDSRDLAAACQVQTLLDKPLPKQGEPLTDEHGNPWDLFPAVYGTYSSSFDDCAINVLQELIHGEKDRDDLGAEMFREFLCTAGLCNYGTSPRFCFPTQEFKPLLPQLLQRWRDYYRYQWGDENDN